MIVRLARSEDESAWRRVWFDAAYEGFGAFLPEGHSYPVAAPGRWQELLADPAHVFLMAEEDGELLGYLSCGSSRDEDVQREVGEVRSLFVAPTAWRRGVGTALMSAGLDELIRRGFTEATVWSFADNRRANAFYEASGFTRDGGEKRQEHWAEMLEVRYRRSL